MQTCKMLINAQLVIHHEKSLFIYLFFLESVSTKLLTVLQDEEITRIYLNTVPADTNKGS